MLTLLVRVSDISKSMLGAASERESETGDVPLSADMGQGLPFRPATLTALLYLYRHCNGFPCYASSTDQDPKLRLNRLFIFIQY
jgi:hypothetical protein